VSAALRMAAVGYISEPLLLCDTACRCRRPTYVDLDVGQSQITIPGTVAATPIEHPVCAPPCDEAIMPAPSVTPRAAVIVLGSNLDPASSLTDSTYRYGWDHSQVSNRNDAYIITVHDDMISDTMAFNVNRSITLVTSRPPTRLWYADLAVPLSCIAELVLTHRHMFAAVQEAGRAIGSVCSQAVRDHRHR